MSSKTTKTTAPKHAVKTAAAKNPDAAQEAQLEELLEELLEGGTQDGDDDSPCGLDA